MRELHPDTGDGQSLPCVRCGTTTPDASYQDGMPVCDNCVEPEAPGGAAVDELVAFVRAALDAEERLARRVADRYTVRNPDRPDNGHPYWPLPSVERNWHFRSEESDSDPDIAAGLDLIKAYNPQRVLAEVQAKRRILDECDSIIYGWTHEETKDYGRDILKALAQPYAGQPGWREEWAI